MNVGERIKFSFGKGEEKEGVILKIFPKRVYLKADFPNHPGKIVVRRIAELEGKVSAKKKKKEKVKGKEKKEKSQRPEEKRGGGEEKK